MKIRIREYDGDPSKKRQGGDDAAAASTAFEVAPECRADYVLGDDGTPPSYSSVFHIQRRMSSMSDKTWKQTLHNRFVIKTQRIFADLFLPIGYPQSVGEGYLQYQFYDSLQGICSYLRGVVSTSAVLMAAGVGDAEATAMSAAVAWAMRDGLGMIGGLLFSYFASSQFDQCVKEYRLFADIINDVGLTLDMLAPYAGRSRVLYITSLATVCKTMCGMAAGATKGSITHHFAIRGNMADLNAKESTQETLVSLLGMICGILLARYLHGLEKKQQQIGDNEQNVEFTANGGGTAQAISWAIFVFLTVVHVWANYLGVKLLRLRTLNRERAEVALKGIIDGCATQCEEMLSKDDGKSPPPFDSFDVGHLLKTIATPHDLSESLWSSTRKLFSPCGVRLGVRLGDAFNGLDQNEMLNCIEQFRDDAYILTVSTASQFGLRRQAEVSIALFVGSSEQDELKAFLHAMIILAMCERKPSVNYSHYISISHQCLCKLFSSSSSATTDTLSLDTLIERGWECNRLYLGYGPWRVHVDIRKED